MNPLAIDAEEYPSPNDTPEICSALESALERARRGEVRSLGLAVIYEDGSWHGESISDDRDNIRLRGALETCIMRTPSGEVEW
jgi:hypothetical protein